MYLSNEEGYHTFVYPSITHNTTRQHHDYKAHERSLAVPPDQARETTDSQPAPKVSGRTVRGMSSNARITRINTGPNQ